MTLKGRKRNTKDEHLLMACLMQLHLDTRPEKVGLLFGVSGKYARQVWGRHAMHELLSLAETVKAARRMWDKYALPEMDELQDVLSALWGRSSGEIELQATRGDADEGVCAPGQAPRRQGRVSNPGRKPRAKRIESRGTAWDGLAAG